MSSVYPPFGGPPAQLCLRCGTPLPFNEVTCVNCGTYNPVAQTGTFSDQSQIQWGGSQQQASFNGGQYSGTQLGQPFGTPSQYNQWGQPSPSQNNVYGTPYAPQSSPPNNFYPMPGQNLHTNVNSFYVAPQQNAYSASPSTTYGGYIQSPQRKRGPKVGLIVGLVLLVVLLTGGAFTGYFYHKIPYQNSTATSTSPTVLVTPTAIPLFSDSFVNNKMRWDLTSNPGEFSVKVGGGSLVLEDDQNKLLWEVVPGKSFTDFRLDVDATLTKGDPNNGYGVLIREASIQNGNLGTYYCFELYGDGSYAIFKATLDANGQITRNQVQAFTVKNAIALENNFNHITIIAKGPTMRFIVNSVSIYTYTDNSYKGGSIALFVSNLPTLKQGAEAIFTHLAIFPGS